MHKGTIAGGIVLSFLLVFFADNILFAEYNELIVNRIIFKGYETPYDHIKFEFNGSDHWWWMAREDNMAFSIYSPANSVDGGIYEGHAFYVRNDGYVHVRDRMGIGTTFNSQSYELCVNGTIRAKEVVVDSNWSDFVFEENYPLKSLSEVESYIKANKHLPDIPPGDEIRSKGVSVGEMQAKLLQKIEELTLYVIEIKKENERIKMELESIKGRP